ncbi:rod shape-determining protein MreC [Miniphocaeibacter halophilus]|uniref:Rod shape-determining protein MreC n=1 Tax=Miniphocaeibacter halophilus TaxID=2931922 RepID=A0AC61MSF9_9FIRM|nr:rod shape-determining protein MreC [Miniphocaeibacter halophilus]QQK07151.1 rod shape-determining protein MreC [Miniphocaeibacter halophilus]
MNNSFRNNNKKRRYVIFITTVLFLISLIVTSKGNNRLLSFGGNIIGTVTTPITKVVYFTSSKLIDGLEFLFGSADMRKENADLNAENAILKKQVENMEMVINNEEYLKTEYDLIKKDKKDYTKAYIVGVDSSNVYDRFTIDKGTVSGVKEKDTIVQGVMGEEGTIVQGLIGTVVDVGLNYAKVSSITDPSAGVSFRTSKSGEIGVITGGSKNKIEGRMYRTEADVTSGDAIYTSGLGGVYPPNLYIGKIKEVIKDESDTEKKIIVESPVDFNNIYRVLILKNEQELDDE